MENENVYPSIDILVKFHTDYTKEKATNNIGHMSINRRRKKETLRLDQKETTAQIDRKSLGEKKKLVLCTEREDFVYFFIESFDVSSSS